MDYVIEMLNITKEFWRHRNDDVTVCLKRGEIHALWEKTAQGNPR